MAYAASDGRLPAQALLVDRTSRVRLEIKGPDRARYLHNLTTNEVKKLAVGRGCETFVTSPQGKTLAYVILHALDDRILLRADQGGLEHAQAHLAKYGVFDDVALDEISAQTFELHLFGGAPRAGEIAVDPGRAEYSHAAGKVADRPVLVIQESPSGHPGLTVIGAVSDRDAVEQAIHEEASATRIDAATFDAYRIAAGTPEFGREVTPANLPQELARDDRAISFVKGCYLGQETVARIDALGHVNRLLVGVSIQPGAQLPAPGVTVYDGEKAVGTLTSVAVSPYDGAGIALGIVRANVATAGTRLALEPGGEKHAIIVQLPLIPGRV